MSSAFTHYLMPKIEKLSEEDQQELFKKMNCTKEDLPVIELEDAGLKGLEVQIGDVIRILRDEKNKVYYYRMVVA